MKKVFWKVLVVVLIPFFVFTLGFLSQAFEGESAYEIAVRNGFEGTEQEWLESLKCDHPADGKSAYEIALDNGFVGTEEEWLASLKGMDGEDGQDLDINQMYQAAVADGFVGGMSAFLKEYFDVEVGQSVDTEIVAHNVMSSVSIISVFDVASGNNTQRMTSSGSGVIYHLEKEHGRAYIVTNYHIVFENGVLNENGIAGIIYVYLYGEQFNLSGETYEDESGNAMRARYVGGSPVNDIAVIAVEDSEIIKNSAAEAVTVRGAEERLRLGESVHAIGNAGGRGLSVVEGGLSCDSEYISLASFENPAEAATHRVMRVDAAINKGNSGGGLFDANGKLLGIVNAKSSGTSMDNVGYAIPMEKVCFIVDEILAKGYADKAILGVMLGIESTTSGIDATGTLYVKERIYISEAPSDATESAYGLVLKGDVITKVEIGTKTLEVERLYQIGDFLIQAEAGDVVKLTIERGGVEI